MTDQQIKKMILTEAQRQGRVQFTRVSRTMIEKVKRRQHTALLNIIKDEVQRHPSLGVTLK